MREIRSHHSTGNLLLLLSMTIFLLNGYLHPLYHPFQGCGQDRNSNHHLLHLSNEKSDTPQLKAPCPVCTGVFQTLDLAEISTLSTGFVTIDYLPATVPAVVFQPQYTPPSRAPPLS